MADTAQIKAAIKALLDSSGQFGSVYTEDRSRIEKPAPAFVVMWHGGGTAEPGPGRSETTAAIILVRVVIPQGPVNGEIDMQIAADSLTGLVRRQLRRNPTLDTGTGPLVQSVRVTDWDLSYDEQNKRMVAELKVAVTHEED